MATSRSRDSAAPTHDYGDADRFQDQNGEHPLWTAFSFWMFSKRYQPPTNTASKLPTKEIDVDLLFSGASEGGDGATTTAMVKKTEYQQYLDCFAKLGPFRTVEGFWKLYSYIKRPNLTMDFTYHCFRGDVHPTWDHQANVNGGKWVIKLRRNYGPRLFEVALLSMIGNEYNLGEELNGVALTCKKQEDVVSIWVSSQDPSSVHRLNQVVKRWIHACYYTFAPGIGGPNNQQQQQQQNPQQPPMVTALDFVPHRSAQDNHKGGNAQGQGGKDVGKEPKDEDLLNQMFGTSNTSPNPTQSTQRPSKFTYNGQTQGTNGFGNRVGGIGQGNREQGFVRNNSQHTSNNNNPRFPTTTTSSNSTSNPTNYNDPSGSTARLQPRGDQGSQNLISNTVDDDDFKVLTFDDQNDTNTAIPTQPILTTAPSGATNSNNNSKDGDGNEPTPENNNNNDEERGFVAAVAKTRSVDAKKTTRAAAKLAEKQAAAAANAAAAKKNPFADLDD